MSPLCFRASAQSTPPCHGILTGIAAYQEALQALTQSGAFPAQNDVARQALDRLLTALAVPLSDRATEVFTQAPEVQASRTAMWHALARYEAGLERAIAAAGNWDKLAQLPFYESQRLLAQAEVALLGDGEPLSLDPGQRIGFVDTGPLPLGALLFHLETGLPVTCFGANAFDAALGQKFFRRLGLSDRAIRFDSALEPPFNPTLLPLILIEARAPRKKQRLRAWRKAEGAVTVGVRSAVGLFGLLYQPLALQLDSDLFMYFEKRTTAAPGCVKTTYFSAAPAEGLIFEKEEPKPDWGDVHFCIEPSHLTHG